MKAKKIEIGLNRTLVLIPLLLGLILTQLPVFALTVPAKVIIRGCDDLSPRDIPSLGLSGAIRFDCAGRAAFSATGKATPTFDLTGTSYDSLGVILHSLTDCSSSRLLEPKGPFRFGGPRQEYDYCAFFANPALREFGGFDIGWRIGEGGP